MKSIQFVILLMRFLLIHACTCFFMSFGGEERFLSLGAVLFAAMLLFFAISRKVKNGSAFILLHVTLYAACFAFFSGLLRISLIISVGIAVALSFTDRFKNPEPTGASGLSLAFFPISYAAALFFSKDAFLLLCASEAVLYAALKFVRDGLINTDSFININKKIAGLPEKGIRRRMLIFTLLFALLASGGMILGMNSGISRILDSLLAAAAEALSSFGNRPVDVGTEPDGFSVFHEMPMPEISNINIKTGAQLPAVLTSLGEILLWAAIIVIGIYLLRLFLIKIKDFSSRFDLREKENETTEFAPPESSEVLTAKKIKLFKFTAASSNDARIRKMYKKYILKHKSDIPRSLTPTQISEHVGTQNYREDADIRKIYEKTRYSRNGSDDADAKKMKELIKEKK